MQEILLDRPKLKEVKYHETVHVVYISLLHSHHVSVSDDRALFRVLYSIIKYQPVWPAEMTHVHFYGILKYPKNTMKILGTLTSKEQSHLHALNLLFHVSEFLYLNTKFYAFVPLGPALLNASGAQYTIALIFLHNFKP